MDALGLIVAAGRGERFGGDLPKVFVELRGVPLFLWALRAYDACPAISRTLLSVTAEHLARAESLCREVGLSKPWEVIAGGARRQDTVMAALEHLASAPPDLIAVHDGARPFIDSDTILRSLELAAQTGGCVTATPVTDTIKQADADGAVLSTPDRAGLWRAQTPQTFRFSLLLDCYRRALGEGWELTDDGSVLERCGRPVRINPGPASNIKVTTPDDLRHAEALLADRAGDMTPPGMSLRIGSGYDVHALTAGRRLIIGGVDIPHETGLAGHSDADVLFHAVCDAVLGAAAAGDIGAMFPDTDAAFEGANSAELCRRVAAHVRDLGHEIVNVDATVIAQRPRMAPHIANMRRNIAGALGVDVSQVSVKATTTERLGFEGREEGIAAQAVALLTGAAGGKVKHDIVQATRGMPADLGPSAGTAGLEADRRCELQREEAELPPPREEPAT